VMNRRNFAFLLGAMVTGLSVCDSEPKPSASATLINNDEVAKPMRSLEDPVDTLEGDVGDTARPAGAPKIGLTFGPDYHSARLTEILESVLRHHRDVPDILSGETKLNLIVVALPTPQEKLSATRCISDAYEQRGLSFASMRDAN
jgi:hypothetical protein